MKPQQSSIDKIRSRPRFKIVSKLSIEEYVENLRIYLKEHHAEFEGNVNREIATISVRTTEDSYYKPYLSLRIETETNDETPETSIRGVFGPSSSVWTFFMFLYFLWSILWMISITLWFVGKQIKTDSYTWGLPVSFLMLTMLLVTYFAVRFGQKKAQKEMSQLQKFAIESTLPFGKLQD